MLLNGLGNPVQLVALVATLLVGLTVHEYAHAWSAFKLGDDTAYMQGRLTLNPLAHIDPMGALMLLVVGFGWAKPVPINPYVLGQRGTLFVALAGPVSNVLLASAGALVLRSGLVSGTEFVDLFLLYFVVFNLALAVFNMLPIAPLDGWRVLLGVVPRETAHRLQAYERYSGVLLLVLIMSGFVTGTSILGKIIWVPVTFLSGLLLGPMGF
jgi:Zn-dependent protease